MNHDYTYNKEPKDAELCRLIRKTITLNRKEIGLEFDDVAHELGMQPGTLANKLKPAMHTNDMSISEFVHFLSLTGDYAALEYIAKKFGFILVNEKKSHSHCSNINILVDSANIENGDVFKAVKMAMADGRISAQEKAIIIAEIEEAQKANAELKDMLLNLETEE